MSRSSSLLLVALVCVLALAFSSTSVAALCKCEKQTEAVGPCSVSLDVCGCVHHWHWKYKCSASAAPTGHSYSYQWTDSGAGAAKHAIVGLFSEMTAAGECNCESGKVPFGKCAIDYRACFYFASEGALDGKTASFKAFVTAPNGAVSEVDAQVTGQAAIANGLAAMVHANPSVAVQCGATEELIKSAMTYLH